MGKALTFKGAGPVGLSRRQLFHVSPVQELLFDTMDDGFPLAVRATKITRRMRGIAGASLSEREVQCGRQ